ncbi:MAG: S8 family serine peptidase [Pseudolabrys sp.]|nr:S8 family serine peptidase [Pseudolabrys sp.]
MRVPVLTVLGAQEPLRESAAAQQASRRPDIPLSATIVPRGIDLDADFPAVPVGTGVAREMSLFSLRPENSSRFIVRGFVDVADPAEVPVFVDGAPVFSDPKIAPFITCGGDPAVGSDADVKQHLKVAALAARGLDGDQVAVAIMDTGINLPHLTTRLGAVPRFDVTNSWRGPNNPTAPGAHPIDHGTMCAFDALIAAPKATLLDYPMLSSELPGGAFSGQTLSVAVQAYAALIAFWAVAYAPGGAPRYKALVVNNSWGMFHPSWDFPAGHPGRYLDNPAHPFAGLVSVLARAGADILFAACNCGTECPSGRCQGRTTETIMGASAYEDVLTLAGCDIKDLRVGYSSQGPSIRGMYRQKPDVTAYTHFLGSQAFGPAAPDTGTSAACPVAAGCVAALRTKLSPTQVPPANLFAQLRVTARAVGKPGWNGDYGHGIIDPNAAAQSLGV